MFIYIDKLNFPWEIEYLRNMDLNMQIWTLKNILNTSIQLFDGKHY